MHDFDNDNVLGSALLLDDGLYSGLNTTSIYLAPPAASRAVGNRDFTLGLPPLLFVGKERCGTVVRL